MAHDIRRFVAACPVCAQAKSSNSSPARLLQPLSIPSRPWSHIALNFVTGLPPSSSNTAVHFVPLPKFPSAKETAQLVFDHVFKIHGLPTNIVFDRGPQFVSQFWREFSRQVGVTVSLSSGFHPQTNCQILEHFAVWQTAIPCLGVSSCLGPNMLTTLNRRRLWVSLFFCCLGYQPPLFSSQEPDATVPLVQAFILRCWCTWRRVKMAFVSAQKTHPSCSQPPAFTSS